jgi:pyrroline-5-carboxylate reductase
MKTAFIGGGVMAEAMFSRAIHSNVLAASDITVSEPVEARRKDLVSHYSVAVAADNQKAIEGAQLIVLAVKPQHLHYVFDDIGGRLSSEQTVLSIIAGTPLRTLINGLGHDAVIRVMPNTPAQVGQGVSVWTTTPKVSDAAKQAATDLLSAMGQQFCVESEAYLDMATAVSGSGPAYVFAFTEALTDAAVYLGIPRDMALKMVLGTILGSAQLMQETGKHPALLREMVTSPGGTTAEALLALDGAGFKAAIMEGVVAAHEKAQALGEEA